MREEMVSGEVGWGGGDTCRVLAPALTPHVTLNKT